jgi:geranylgeranyl diphosphate synthase type I
MQKPASKAVTPHDDLLDQSMITAHVDAYLRDFFSHTIERAAKMDTRAAELWSVIERVTLAGGKRLRPYLVMLAYQAYGGRATDTIIPVAVAQELLHVSLLMHDDIIDKDFMRHGQLNVAGMMREQYVELASTNEPIHYANGAALLGGDLLIGAAHHIIAVSTLSDAHKLTALNELDSAIFCVGAGEFLDMESVLLPFAQTDALHIIDLKTAHYSCIVPLTSGARLAGADMTEITLLERLGAALGAAFQLADDMLGVYGDEAVTGKSTLSDIREGKHTYLMEQAMVLCSPAEKRSLMQALGNDKLTHKDLAGIRRLLEECGAKDTTLKQIKKFSDTAIHELAGLTVSDQAKAAFMNVINRAAKRAV